MGEAQGHQLSGHGPSIQVRGTSNHTQQIWNVRLLTRLAATVTRCWLSTFYNVAMSSPAYRRWLQMDRQQFQNGCLPHLPVLTMSTFTVSLIGYLKSGRRRTKKQLGSCYWRSSRILGRSWTLCTRFPVSGREGCCTKLRRIGVRIAPMVGVAVGESSIGWLVGFIGNRL